MGIYSTTAKARGFIQGGLDMKKVINVGYLNSGPDDPNTNWLQHVKKMRKAKEAKEKRDRTLIECPKNCG